MLFNSYEYLIFFPLVTIAYFAIPHRFRWGLLLVCSYYFYMRWQWEFAGLMLFTTAINYVCGNKIADQTSTWHRRFYLLAAIIGSMGPLFYYKYYNFANNSLERIFTALEMRYPIPYVEVILPVGISFFTFHSLTYTWDIYLGTLKPQRHFGKFALFVAFFPQLVAGPIHRSRFLLPQFDVEHRLDLDNVAVGLKLIIWGLFKKVVVADRLAMFVGQIYADPQGYNGSTLALATWFFAFQIYCDFSAYSDICVGSGRILGFTLMQNFRVPYMATSISDFWSRWHISLSTWFRDYLYIPLGGNRVALGRWIFNIVFVFTVSGLWHGASWTFVLWGFLHGMYYVIGRALQAPRAWFAKTFRIPEGVLHVMRVVWIFHLVLATWVFFRAGTMHDALYILGKMATDLLGMPYLGSNRIQTVFSAGMILVLIGIQILQEKGIFSLYASPSKAPVWLQWIGYYLLVLAIIGFGVSSNAFIYFQF